MEIEGDGVRGFHFVFFHVGIRTVLGHNLLILVYSVFLFFSFFKDS